MNYFKQIWYEMRHQKMMMWVSVAGTALSIFLVMAFYMADRVLTVAVSPESDRDRILTGAYMDLYSDKEGWSTSGAISYDAVKRIYGNLDGVEKVSYTTCWDYPQDVGLQGKRPVAMTGKSTDATFWDIYDFRFISGKPYDSATADAGGRSIVLTRSAARSIFSADDVAGQEVMVDHVPYVVSGVVEDVPLLLKSTASDFYIPLDHNKSKYSGSQYGYTGQLQALLLLSPGVDREKIRRQVEGRYKAINNEIMKDSMRIVYHQQPFDSKTMAIGGFGSNNDPDMSGRDTRMLLIYTVLLLLPAINLSSMTRSRLRHRVSEIGVRRAFGASRRSIVGQILGENLIITLAGGVIGLVVCVLFMMLVQDLFFGISGGSLLTTAVNPTMGMLFTWDVFLVSLAFCFVLNLVSAFIPAWRASGVVPALAISKSR